MVLKLFEVVEQFLIGHFSLLNLSKFEKTGLIRLTFISLGNLIINFHFRNQKSITFFVTFTLSLFDSGVCLHVKNGNALISKKKLQSSREKSKLSVNKF